jgi:uroporphyrin-III C-methyltransferase/precorrin-2 dehydrogenase/sirohydrochlorin ferrochelatase
MNLREQPCLVVGGGDVAARKAALLLRAAAQVTLVAPALEREVLAMQTSPQLRCEERAYRSSDVAQVVLVVAASGDRALDAQVSADARALRLPINVVDAPALCSFIVPALVERASLTIAIGTAGSAPVLARLVRGRLEAALPERYGDLVELCARLREEVRARLPDVNARRRFWEENLEGGPAELVFRGELAAAESALRAALSQPSAAESRQGEAYLIGAGPNDPELVSFRGQRLLQRAELVLYASDVAEVIVDLSRRDAQRESFSASLDPAPLLQRVAANVRAGQRVCVLARGDYFRSPAGMRFAARAAELGVPCQVIPGIADRGQSD